MDEIDDEIHGSRWRKCEHGVFRLLLFVDGLDVCYHVIERVPLPDPNLPWREKRLGVIRRATDNIELVAKRAIEIWGQWKNTPDSYQRRGFVHNYSTNWDLPGLATHFIGDHDRGTACGTSAPPNRITEDPCPLKVTCRRCRKTKVYNFTHYHKIRCPPRMKLSGDCPGMKVVLDAMTFLRYAEVDDWLYGTAGYLLGCIRAHRSKYKERSDGKD